MLQMSRSGYVDFQPKLLLIFDRKKNKTVQELKPDFTSLRLYYDTVPATYIV